MWRRQEKILANGLAGVDEESAGRVVGGEPKEVPEKGTTEEVIAATEEKAAQGAPKRMVEEEAAERNALAGDIV